MNREYRLSRDRGSVNPWDPVRKFDPNMNIFRYMNFEKFVRLMITKSLYFPRLDELEDEFEGSPRIKITQVATYKILGLCAPFASQIVADSLMFVA